jgi:chaperone BCS1
MTTNHIERLDPALIRPGRVDVSELIDDADPHQARHLFVRFYQADVGDSEGKGWEGEGEGVGEEEVERLGDILQDIVNEQMKEGRRISMAALQGLFIRCGAEDAIRECRALFVKK